MEGDGGKTKKRNADSLESGDGDSLLEATLASLPEMLTKRQKRLEERENELEKAVAAFKKETSVLCGDAKPSDVLHLNVGGTTMAVLRRTLTSVPGSMLASRFSGRWDDSIEKDRDGNFFIDQPFRLFEPMVDYLRARACETPRSVDTQCPTFEDVKTTHDFCRMVEYYGMTLWSTTE
jgi:hypothetical protein